MFAAPHRPLAALGLALAALALPACGNREPIVDSPRLPNRDLVMLGLSSLHSGNLELAAEQFAEAYEEATAIDDVDGRADATYNLGLVERARRRFTEAKERFVEAERLYGVVGDRTGVARATTARGSVLAAEGRHAEAKDLYEETLQDADEPIQAEVRTWLVVSELAVGRVAAARAQAELAVEQSASNVVLADALYNLASVLLEQDELPAAEAALERSLELDRRAARRPEIADGLELLAIVVEKRGDRDRAASLRERARGVRESMRPDGEDPNDEASDEAP